MALNLRDGQLPSNNFACFSAGSTSILPDTDFGCGCNTRCNATGHSTHFEAPVTIDVGGLLLSENRDRPFFFGMNAQSWLLRPSEGQSAWPLKLTLIGMRLRQFQYFVSVRRGRRKSAVSDSEVHRTVHLARVLERRISRLLELFTCTHCRA